MGRRIALATAVGVVRCQAAMSTPASRSAQGTKQEHKTSPKRWAQAAALGMLAAACNEKPSGENPKGEPAGAVTAAVQAAAASASAEAKNCCMGLNACKGQGGCAVPESHACAGKNECKGKGGCNMHCPK